MIQGILLAAGKSRRFGSNKLFTELPSGEPMLLQSAKNLSMAMDNVLVVLHPKDKKSITMMEESGFQTYISRYCEKGMGHTLSEVIAQTKNADGWVIALADMPFIEIATLQAIVSKLETGVKLCAPYYKEKRGHPTGICSQFKSELLNLSGDIGAKNIFLENESIISKIMTTDSNILKDIDTIEDLDQFKR